MEFDEILESIGAFGYYQRVQLFFLSFDLMPAVFANLGYVFWAAVPEHWCFVAGLDHGNWTLEERKAMSIPMEERDGQMVYSRCRMYDKNYTQLGEQWTPFNESYRPNNISTIPCSSWTYDQSIYTSTIVSQVRVTHCTFSNASKHVLGKNRNAIVLSYYCLT